MVGPLVLTAWCVFTRNDLRELCARGNANDGGVNCALSCGLHGIRAPT